MASPAEVIAAMRRDAGALMQMGALEYAVKGKPRAEALIANLLALLEHVVTVQAATAINLTRDFAELRARLDALEGKPSPRSVVRAVQTVVEEQCRT